MNPTIGQRTDWRSAFGHLLRGVVGVLVALLLVRTWLLEPFVVPSSSMAPTLLGVHAEMVCGRCRYRIVYGLDDGPASRVVCPNCCHVQVEDAEPPGLNGDRVLVDRGAFRWRRPRRWEPVAFRSPSKASDIVVKRVVGLPGETIKIHNGDVYADGRIQRKTLAEQQAMAIPVYGTAFVHPAGPEHRWGPDALYGQWQRTDGRFLRIGGPADRGASPDWLIYHHCQLKPGSSTETIESPITDRCGYNQTQSRRELYPVRDLALAFRLRAVGDGQILVAATDGAVEFRLRLDLKQHEAELLRDGVRVTSAPCEFRRASSEARLYVSLFDEQVCVAWNDEQLLCYPYQRPQPAGPASSRPFRIAGVGGQVEVWDSASSVTSITRLHPLSPWGLGETRARLRPGEYFVLGDNSPQSRDSRWNDIGTGISERLLIGRPLVVYFPARLMHAGGRSFQVPEFSNIRYIR